MSGDFTRNSFRPAEGFSLVRLQQGRVLTDADWNEQAEIQRWRARRTRVDVIGPTGFPDDAAGFALVSVESDLALMPGRGYVEGVQVENLPLESTRLVRVSGAGSNSFFRVESGPLLAVGQPLAPADGDLAQATLVAETDVDGEGRQTVRLAADIGTGDEHDRLAGWSLTAQPHRPPVPGPGAAGPYLVYLDVWERLIFALEAPLLREVALGGPDTAGREKVLWQARLLPLQDLIDAGNIPEPPTCKSFPAGWSPEGDGPQATLAARAEPVAGGPDPCVLPADGGLRVVENRLFRAETHNGGVVGTDAVTIKWSRDNAMHRARLLEVVDGALRVSSVGLDDATAFSSGQWLEVRDEARILEGQPGFFVQISEVTGDRIGVGELLDPDDQLPLTDNGAPDVAMLPSTGEVRRWEGGPPVEIAADEWTPLEDGLEIRMAPGRSRTGDYWTIPGRTITVDIEWPADPASGEPLALPPEGVTHRYTALAIVTLDGGGWTVDEDCRHLFPPLTELETLHYLGGDGQEATPDLTQPNQLVRVDAPLRVGVARGETPVQGRPVRFTTEPADGATGLIAPPGADVVSASPDELIVRTDADGVASAELEIGPARTTHTAVARLLDAVDPPQADPIHLEVRFTANVSIAAEVAYDPSDCRYQGFERIEPRLTRTVQQAVDKLCPQPLLTKLAGDGQLLCGRRPAAIPLRVGFTWGRAPLEQVRIGFAVESGDARVSADTVPTDADGVAETILIAGENALEDGGIVRVRARPIEPPAEQWPLEVLFHARFLNGECVYLDPDICPDGQQTVGRNTVAALIDHLCRTGGGGNDIGLHVQRITLISTSGPLEANSNVQPPILARGVLIAFDQPVARQALGLGRIGRIRFDAPYPPNVLQQSFSVDPDFQVPLRVELEIAGTFTPRQGDFSLLEWRPDRRAQRWLLSGATNFLSQVANFDVEEINARLELYGNSIWSEADPDVFLDGDLFVGTNGARFPSGDGRRGGDLVLPFNLSR